MVDSDTKPWLRLQPLEVLREVGPRQRGLLHVTNVSSLQSSKSYGW